MDRIEVYDEIRSMQITYSLHFILYLVLGVEHILMVLKLFWNNDKFMKVFISISAVDLILLIYPIFPLIYMYRIIVKKKLVYTIKILSFVLIIVSLIFGIIINIFFWLNLKSTTSFSRECPYNLNDLKLFKEEADSSERCGKRRCVLESIDNSGRGYPYNYICNYNSEGEFELDPNQQYKIIDEHGNAQYLKYYVACEKKDLIDDLIKDATNKQDESEISIYLQKCWNNDDIKNFYICQRYELPNKFDIDEEYKCPKDNYNIILYLSGIFLIVLDIILAFIPWSLDYKSYSKILSIINEEENIEVENNNEQQRQRHNETNTSSNNRNINNSERNSNNNENDNENESDNNRNRNSDNFERNNENEFIHQPTETIIIAKDRRTVNNSSNIRSDRLNSGLNSRINSGLNSGINSNDISKSNLDNSNNDSKARRNIKINSMISKSDSQNMISNNSENQNQANSENDKTDKKIVSKNNRNNNVYNNENDDFHFNNIRYDNDEDVKAEKKQNQNNCLINNRNINININNNKNAKKKQDFNKKEKIIVDSNEDTINSKIKEGINTIKTTIGHKNDENIEDNKNNEINDNELEKNDNYQFYEIDEEINEDYHNKTPTKELRSLNFNFSNVLTNIRESDQVTLFKNTNKSIIKEERKEDTEKSIKEEEKNNNKSSNENRRQNLSMITPLKLRTKSNDNGKNEEKKNDERKILKNDSQSSLLAENSHRSLEYEQMNDKNKNQIHSNLIKCTENE